MSREKRYLVRFSLMLAGGFIILGLFLYNLKKQDIFYHKQMADIDAWIFSDDISRTMDSSEQVTKILEYNLIAMDGDTSFFEDTAERLYSKLDYVNSIQLAPGGVVSYIYPKTGNEKGFIDLLNDPERGPVVKYGIEHKVITAQGPFELKQGGKGIAIRNPVFLKDGSFWGFSIAVIDSDKLIDADVRTIEKNNYNYLIEKTESVKNKTYLTVARHGRLNDPVTVTFESGACRWRLSIEKKGGWFQSHSFILIAFLGMAIVILIAGLSYMLMLDHQRQIDLENAARIDFLTGVMNRQGMFESTEEYISKNHGQPFAVVMLDVDNFKIINDCYGHSTGDNSLKALAQALQETFPKDSLIGRYGGDEFYILIKNRTPDQIEVYLKRLLENEIHYKTSSVTTDILSMSVGYAAYPTDSDDPEEIIRLADHALYNSKEHGKNRFEAYHK